MSTIARIAIVALLAVAVAGVVVARRARPRPAAGEGTAPAAAVPLPRLVDVGRGQCVACKMMEPVLEELRKEFAGRLQVDYVDLGADPDAAEKFGIEIIPTQIFFDADGEELFRHQGFFGKDDIVAKWKELGVDLSEAPSAKAATSAATRPTVPCGT